MTSEFKSPPHLQNALFAFLALLLILPPNPAHSAKNPPNRQVLAFYYTWYGTPEGSRAWRHWDEGGHHPDRKTPSGLLDTGTTDHPLKLYDSHDPAVLRMHLNQAADAGIDALISTWWGQGDWHDVAFKLLLKEAEDRNHAQGSGDGRPVFVTAYYEQVPGAADPVSAAVADFLYILSAYGDRPAFYHFGGKPVLFVYSRAVNQLSPDQWKTVIARVKAKHPAYIVGDSTDPALYSVFDTLHEYNPVGAVVEGTAMGPRYRKLVQDARQRHRTAVVTVIPGYDDSHIGRATPLIAPREKGRLYARLWNAALDATPDWTLITTFNEWHEGSEIETSHEYGDLFMRLTRDYSAMVHSGKPVVALTSEDQASLPKGWRIEPVHGSRLVIQPLPGDGIGLLNRSAGKGEFKLTAPGEEPYVFEVGKEGRLWRVSTPLDSSASEYALPTLGEAQVWTP
jgi:hypothetical protein